MPACAREWRTDVLPYFETDRPVDHSVCDALACQRGEVSLSRYVDAYPTAASKKGLQVEDVADGLRLASNTPR